MALNNDQSGIDTLKQVEQTLSLEKEFSRSLLESMADGVVACDEYGILTLFNRSAREWHGLDPLKLPPEEWARHYDLFRADGITPLPTEEIPLARAFRGENVRDAGMAIKAKGQPIRFILANGSVILDESGQKLGAVVIMRDVTEFRRLELELRKTNEELEQRVEKRTEELRKTAEDFNEAQRIAHIGSWELDLLTSRLFWSDEIYRIFEIDPKEFGASYETFLQAVHPDDREAVNAAYTNSVSTRNPYSIDHRLLLPGGRIKHVHEQCETLYENDKPIRSAGTVQDITGRKRMEDALFFVAQRGWLSGAENFFDALAQYLGENLDMDYVVIDRIDENPAIAETVALYAKGAIVPNMRYALKGTPCENVMGRRLCVYPQGVQQLFPEDALLAEMGVESYLGIPLWDSSGQPAGLIALMDSKPLPDTATATQLLQLVATRAAAEMERTRSDRLLREREHEYRTLANSLPDNIVRYDREGRTVYVNPVLERILGAAAVDMIGTQVRDIHPDGSYEAYAQALDATLASGENCEFELILPVPGEEPVVHQIRLIAEHDDHGDVTGVLAIGRDITERKRMEEERSQNFRYFENMDKVNRAIQAATDLEGMLSEVLDAVLTIFDCDRVYLVYPCDPEASFWQALIERTKPEYPGNLAMRTPYPMDDEVAKLYRVLLAANGPVKLDSGTDELMPAQVSKAFGIRSQICEAIYPKIGKPWMFGMHQCSYPRVWTKEEERLLDEIAMRLADGLNAMLASRDLQESEQRFRMVFENSPVSIWEEDFSGVRTFFDSLKKEGVADIEQYLDCHPDAVRYCAELAMVIDVNRAALTLHGAVNKEELFAGLVNTFTPESFATFRQELVCLWNGVTEMERDAVVKTLAGEPHDVTVYFSVCPGYEGTLARILVSLADITERKRAEEALRLQTTQLEEEVAERQMTQENLQEKALLLEEEIEKRQKTQEELEQLNKTLELRVRERTIELEEKNTELHKMNRLFVGRELKMVELKERIRELEKLVGHTVRSNMG